MLPWLQPFVARPTSPSKILFIDVKSFIEEMEGSMTEFPLFLFTTLGGIAAGACAVRAVLPLTKERKQTWLFR